MRKKTPIIQDGFQQHSSFQREENLWYEREFRSWQGYLSDTSQFTLYRQEQTLGVHLCTVYKAMSHATLPVMREFSPAATQLEVALRRELLQSGRYEGKWNHGLGQIVAVALL
jgi:hypothetical protein